MSEGSEDGLTAMHFVSCWSAAIEQQHDVDDAMPRYAHLHRDKRQALEVTRGEGGQRANDHLTESIKAIWTYLRRMGGGDRFVFWQQL